MDRGCQSGGSDQGDSSDDAVIPTIWLLATVRTGQQFMKAAMKWHDILVPERGSVPYTLVSHASPRGIDHTDRL